MNDIVKATLLAIATAAGGTAYAADANSMPAGMAGDNAAMEKCYGVAKAGKNDCGTKTHACAMQTKADGDPEGFVYLPKGSCEKLVNGTLTPASDNSKANTVEVEKP